MKNSEKTNLRTKDPETSVCPTSRRNLQTETEEWKTAREKQKIKKCHQSTKHKNGDNSSSTTLKNFLKDLSSRNGSKRMLQWAEVVWWARKSIDYWSIIPNILRFLKKYHADHSKINKFSCWGENHNEISRLSGEDHLLGLSFSLQLGQFFCLWHHYQLQFSTFSREYSQ